MFHTTLVYHAVIIIFISFLFNACEGTGNELNNEKATCSRPEIGCFSETWQISAQTYRIRLLDSEPKIPERGSNQWLIEVSAKDNESELLTACSINLNPNMPEHGHSSPVIPMISEQDSGRYEISDLVFNMPGLWVLEFFIDCSTTMDQELSIIYAFWLDG